MTQFAILIMIEVHLDNVPNKEKGSYLTSHLIIIRLNWVCYKILIRDAAVHEPNC